MMRDGAPRTIFRKDYQAPAFQVSSVSLFVDIRPGETVVEAELQMTRVGNGTAPLILNGEELSLQSISINGTEITDEHYVYDGKTLTIADVPSQFVLSSRVGICPESNTSLEGLYRSRTIYCTQCEAEGFRKITFYPDRPDVLAVFEVTIEADKESCPILLSNGNLIAVRELPNGRHQATWHDPWPKSAHLFALVAGDLVCVEGEFVTGSGRKVDLRIYVEAKDADYCAHAMTSLQRSMAWDEQVYGLEYDLDLFNIVAVDDFNMGAMENKSLNIFNTSCVLAAPDITTDAGYQRIEGIVAHEYFHNYSGNRVTCRDWFQLTLKEGFTVFRDAEFSADMNSRGVKRVEDVAFLRTNQFAEDAGPMAHPIRPDSFIEISNFYTLTVYEKGSEVIRMMHTLLGHDAFIAGARHYFETFDGRAVTCDDFVDSMQHVSGRDLSQFRRWYQQPGTPELAIKSTYDAAQQRVELWVNQTNTKAGGVNAPPLHIPLAVGLLISGKPITFDTGNTTMLLEVTDREQQFVIDGVPEKPVLSLLRGFSAPVRLEVDTDEHDLATLIAGDDDDFVRWDSAQRFASRVIEQAMSGEAISESFFSAFERVIDTPMDPAMKALLLTLPSEDYLLDLFSQRDPVDPLALYQARETVKHALGLRFGEAWRRIFRAEERAGDYEAYGEQIGQRSLRHVALDYLSYVDDSAVALAVQLFESADNLTDRLAGIRSVIKHGSAKTRDSVLDGFLQAWRDEALVVNQWFSMQATRPASEAVEEVERLAGHEAFDWRNPNKVRALIGAFASANLVGFHRADGAGYRLLADAIIKLQADNPQIAARLCTPLTRYRRYAIGQENMRAELGRIARVEDLSRDVFEVVERALAG